MDRLAKLCGEFGRRSGTGGDRIRGRAHGKFRVGFLITGVISILGAVSWVFVLGRIEPVQWSSAGPRADVLPAGSR